MPTLEDEEIITEAMKHWDDDQGSVNRSNWEADLEFYAGNHWDEYLKALRQGSVGGARPCLVIDRLHVHAKNISNRIRQEKPSMSVSPVDDEGDIETADVMRGILRHIENISMSTEQYAQAAETQVPAGVAYLRAYVSHGAVRGSNTRHDIYNSVIPDIFSVAMDPLSRNIYGLDAAWGLIVSPVDRTQVQAQWPDANSSDFSTPKGTRNWKSDDDEISLCEYFRIEKQKDGDAGVTWYLLTSGAILDRRELRYDYIPIVRVPGEVVKTRSETTYRGIIFRGMDSQKMYDYWKSCEAEMLALAPKAPYLAAEGQLDGYEVQWKRANVDNIPFLYYKTMDAAGNTVGAPQRAQPPQASSMILQGVEGAAEDIRGTTGQHAPSLGYAQPGQSGVAVNALASEGDTATYHFIDHQRGAITALCIININMIPKVYGSREVVRIIGEDDERSFAKIDPTLEQASIEARMPNGKVERIYNLGVGQYDVVASTGLSFATKRAAAENFIQKVVGTAPELWKIWGDMLIRLSDVEGSKEMAERLKRTIPPEILYSPEERQRKQQEEQAGAGEGAEGGPGAEAEGMMQEAEQRMGELQQAMQKMEQQSQLLDAKLRTAKAEVALKEAQIQQEEGKYAGEQMERLAGMQQGIAQELIQHVERAPIVVQVAPPPPTRATVLIRPLPGGSYAGEILKESAP